MLKITKTTIIMIDCHTRGNINICNGIKTRNTAPAEIRTRDRGNKSEALNDLGYHHRPRRLGQCFVYKVHCVAKVYAVLPVSTVKCLDFPEVGNEGGREATPTSISIFEFYGIKTL